MYTAIRKIIEAAWENRELLKKEETRSAIDQVIGLLDKGKLRTATPTDEGWQVNEWVKKAVILYFPTQPMSTMTTGPFEYHDKIRLKQDYAELGVRVVPPAAARYGAYVAPGVVMMPSYVNIGAYVDSGTMVDTWATVGSCAQIGKMYISAEESESEEYWNRYKLHRSLSRTTASSVRVVLLWKVPIWKKKSCWVRIR